MGQSQSSQDQRLPFESRGQVMKEILSSEEKYVLILKKIQSYYQVPLLKGRNIVSDKKKAEIIFANSAQLLEMHSAFLADLVQEKEREPDEPGPKKTKRKASLLSSMKQNIKKAKEALDEGDDPDVQGVDAEVIELETLAEKKFGSIFLDHGKGFEKEYHKYVSNYSSALKELIRCESKSKFRKFARKAAKKAGTPLASFLVLPVLRVGEYAYLLNSLVALTDEDHPDFDDCKDALDHISEVSEYINEERRKAENMNNTFQIQFSFVDKLHLIAKHRILIKEGEIVWSHKKGLGGTAQESIHYFLFSDIVVFAKHVASVKQVLTKFSFQKNHYKLWKFFPLSRTRVVAVPGSSAIHNQLELTCDDETYTFQVQSKDEQRNYVNTFYKASVEADLFKDVWPADRLDITKSRKTRKQKKDDKEKAAKNGTAPPDTADDETDYEETEYEESEMEGGGSDNEDEFDRLWEEDDDESFPEDNRKKDPKSRVLAHIEKALSAADINAKRKVESKQKKPLGKSSGKSPRDIPTWSKPKPKNAPKKGRSNQSDEEDDDDDDDDDEEEDERPKKKPQGKNNRRQEDDDDDDDDEDEDEEEDRKGKKPSRRQDDSDEEESDDDDRPTRTGRGGGGAGRRRDPEYGRFRKIDDDDAPLLDLEKRGGGCEVCTIS